MNAQQMAEEVVQKLTPSAAGTYQNAPFWHSPAIRGAFLAGVDWQSNQLGRDLEEADKVDSEANGERRLEPEDIERGVSR